MCKEPHQNTGNSACLYVLHVYSVTYYKATSCFVSRPDEPNPVLSFMISYLSRRDGLSCRLGFCLPAVVWPTQQDNGP